MSYQAHNPGRFFAATTKTISFAILLLFLLSSWTAVKADWESDANARIEANRKRDAQITVWDTDNGPVPDVNVTIQQVKHHFGFGTCLAHGLITNTDHQNFVLDHFEWAVCENETKWSSNESTRDVWTFSQADYIADWCADNDIVLRGHTLVWETGSQTPGWVSGLECETYPTPCEMLEEIDERIDYTVGRYAGQIVQWDVDNEMLSGNMFDCLGEEGRAHFFNRGNSVDPNCGFYMNEYSGNSFGGYDGWTYANRASGLISLGGAVEGLGIQAHVGSPFRPEDYYNDVLEPLATLGLPIIATEFDTDAGTITQAATDLENLYRICFSHSNVEGIIMWGYDENAVWRGSGIVNTSTWVLNQAGERYVDLLEEWTTSDSNMTDSSGNATFRGFHGTYEITLSAPDVNTEVHTIELEPGSGTQTFILETNFPPTTPDLNAPEPDPMTWASAPSATGPTSIIMTATTATDDNPPILYYFECTTDGDANSGWQENPTYEATGLDPSMSYPFRVKARDSAAAQNETGWSSTISATTDPPDLTPPNPDPMTWASVPTLYTANSITMTATTAIDDVTPPVEYYFQCTTDGTADSGWQSSPTYLATGLDYLTPYTFRVKARDSAPALNETGWSNIASETSGPQPTDIEILGSWATGTMHTQEAGTSRALIFIAHSEDDTAITLNSVTYGNQPMTKVIEEVVGTSYRAYAAAFILDEDGIAAASGSTFVPTWSTTPDDADYSSVFLANVDQTEPIGDSDTNSNASSTPTTITTDPLSTNEGDMVIVAATCGNVSNYTLNNGFTEAAEIDMSSSTGSSGYKSATGADETPSVTNSNLNRQVIIGFVVQSMPSIVDYPPAAPTGLDATAGDEMVSLDWNDNNEPDMNGYNVYRSTDEGGPYTDPPLNSSLLSSSDYIDDTVTNEITYYYVVTAVDANNNESADSNEDWATPTSGDPQNCPEVQLGGYRLASDFNFDCYVDYGDIEVITYYWLSTDCSIYSDCERSDFEPDGDVDSFDFSNFAQQWMWCNDPEDTGCTPNW